MTEGIYYGETTVYDATVITGIIKLDPGTTRRYQVEIGLDAPFNAFTQGMARQSVYLTDKNGKITMIYAPAMPSGIWKFDNVSWKTIDVSTLIWMITSITVREKLVSDPKLWDYEQENEMSFEGHGEVAFDADGFEWDNTNPGASGNKTIYTCPGAGSEKGRLTITAINNSAVAQQLNLNVSGRQWVGSLAAGATASFTLPIAGTETVVVQDIAGQAAKSYSVVGVVSFA